MPKIIRTRYAPSPTGLFHIGGARTALFNYLFSKKNNGDFIVRIEDSDFERNVENGIDSQLENLRWLKIFFDESILNPGNYGPYIQSEKLERYKELAFKLLEEEKAYRCFCTSEELEKNRQVAKETRTTPKYNKKCFMLTPEEIQIEIEKNTPFSIRLNIDGEEDVVWNDLIRGEISIPTNALTDPVILKSNGYPTYNFAVVIDDYDMVISHVIRGEEHISNTPYQIKINNALNINLDIVYGHLSIIVDETGKKLSKRNIELKQFIEDYKNMGFTSESVVNFLYLLGIAATDNNEIFDITKAIKNFDISKIGKSPSTFDFKKMEWISSEYFKKMSNSLYLSFVEPFVNLDLSIFNNNKNDVLLLFKNQISYAKQLNDLINDLFFSQMKLNDMEKQLITFPNLSEFAKIILDEFSKIDDWNEDIISATINTIKTTTNRSGKELYMPIRILITHTNHGPDLSKIIFLFGKDKTISNIKDSSALIERKK
ncbi:MAG: glutamate--tRNA ligase [Malacoplasma sp.]